MRLGSVLLAALALVAVARAEPIVISTSPVHLTPERPEQTEVGRLVWRGGLVLSSPRTDFGGFSGLLVSSDGTRLLAVSDEGSWFSARLGYKEGRLERVSDGDLAPMRDLDGVPMSGKAADAEGLAALSPAGIDGEVAVSFERDHRVWRYDFGRDGVRALPRPIAMPPDLASAERNGGLEALTLLDGRRLLALTEHSLTASGAIRGWIVPLKGGEAAPIALRRDGLFSLTDMARLPDGDLLLLERRFTMLSGPAMQLRRIARADIQPGALLDGPVVARLGMDYSIDNMEGLAVREGPEGETLVYVLSDNNFNALQRTLLLMFELVPEEADQPRPR